MIYALILILLICMLVSDADSRRPDSRYLGERIVSPYGELLVENLIQSTIRKQASDCFGYLPHPEVGSWPVQNAETILADIRRAKANLEPRRPNDGRSELTEYCLREFLKGSYDPVTHIKE